MHSFSMIFIYTVMHTKQSNYRCMGYQVIFNYHYRMVAKSNTVGNQHSLYNSMIASVHITR